MGTASVSAEERELRGSSILSDMGPAERRLHRQTKRHEYNQNYYKRKRRRKHDSAPDDRKVPLTCRLPEWLVARLQRLAAEGLVTGKYPCKTMSEAVKWVVSIGMKHMADDPGVGDKMKYVEARQAIDGIRSIRREAASFLHTATEEVAELMSIGAKREAAQYFHTAIEAIRSLPPTIWSEETIRKFSAKFPELARMKVPGVKMVIQGKKRR